MIAPSTGLRPPRPPLGSRTFRTVRRFLERSPGLLTKPFVAAVSTALALGFAGQALSKSIQLPPDGVQLKASSLPGYAKAQAQCVACHSAEYMVYQPPSASRPYWDAMVKRMKAVFKAPLDDADIPEIVDYLVKTYGSEQPR